jgi:hypothetical protein
MLLISAYSPWTTQAQLAEVRMEHDEVLQLIAKQKTL